LKRLISEYGDILNPDGSIKVPKSSEMKDVTQRTTALATASFYGHENVVNYLLENVNVDPRAFNDIALFTAVAGNHSCIVNQLIGYGCRLQEGNMNPLLLAARNDMANIVDILLQLDSGTSIWIPAFEAACEEGHYEIVVKIMKAVSPPGTKFKNQIQPPRILCCNDALRESNLSVHSGMFAAIINENWKIVDVLLELWYDAAIQSGEIDEEGIRVAKESRKAIPQQIRCKEPGQIERQIQEEPILHQQCSTSLAVTPYIGNSLKKFNLSISKSESSISLKFAFSCYDGEYGLIEYPFVTTIPTRSSNSSIISSNIFNSFPVHLYPKEL
jgi:hypothetical protein